MSGQKIRHGRSNSPEYKSWCMMKQRCTNPNYNQFDDYGGRGITFCERWMLFDNFFADMGERPKGTTLDRIDNTKGYDPTNCRWATRREQQLNKRDTRNVTIDGQAMCVSHAAKQLGLPIGNIYYWAGKLDGNFQAAIERVARGR